MDNILLAVVQKLLKYYESKRIVSSSALAPMPCDYVYLASGALDGARILLGSKNVTAGLKRARAHLQGIVAAAGYAGNELANINKNLGAGVCVHRSVFNAYFPQSVSAYEIEDILCIYKGCFALGGTKLGCAFPNLAAIVNDYGLKKTAQPANS